MAARRPRIFLSSTFYDLRHLRAELSRALEEVFDYEVLASEHATFPIDPDADTIENCTRRVREEADILVLIVGGRYGRVPSDQSRSVTNLEYLAARAKGIPVYAFVARDVLGLLPVFERSPEADFSAVVDTPKLLAFVAQLRSQDRIWVFPFDDGADVLQVLKRQFSYRLAAGLELEIRLRQSDGLEGVHGPALRLALEAPPGWQGLFFAAMLRQSFDRLRPAYEAHRTGASWGEGERVEEDAVGQWARDHLDDAARHATGLSQILNGPINEALAGADVPTMRAVADLLGEGFGAALAWAGRVRRAHVPPAAEPLQQTLAGTFDEMFGTLLRIPASIETRVAEARASGERITVQIDVPIRLPNGWEEQVRTVMETASRRTPR